MPIAQQFTQANIEDCPKDKIPVMTCEGVHPKFKEFAVKTTHKEVNDTFVAYSAEETDLQKHIFVKTLMRMTQWSDQELTQHYHNNSKEWGQFCDDVLDFYVVRFILMKTPIPIFLQ